MSNQHPIGRAGRRVVGLGVVTDVDIRPITLRDDFNAQLDLGQRAFGVYPAENRASWLYAARLRAGQGLHRLLLHAASRWVFASLHTELLEISVVRALIRNRLALPGAPQMLLQLGVADTTHPTGRRPPDELIEA